MNGLYQWVSVNAKNEIVAGAAELEAGVKRVFRVTDLSTTPQKTVDVPLEVGLARIKIGHQGAKTRDELLVGKTVCDKNDVDLIRKWMAGPATPTVIAEYEDAMAAQRAEIEKLRADLAAATATPPVEPDPAPAKRR